MTTRRQWSRAKAHVARGHEEEKRRLELKGRRAGAVAGAVAALARRLARGRLDAATIAAIPAGVLVGHLLGERTALKRLELSQRRGEEGHYAPLREKQAAFSVKMAPTPRPLVSATATQARGELWRTKRSTTRPVNAKPKVTVAPPTQPPVVAPTSATPAMTTSPIAKTGAREGMKKTLKKRERARGAVDDMGEPRPAWRGQVEKPVPGPENQPEPESWRGRDF